MFCLKNLGFFNKRLQGFVISLTNDSGAPENMVVCFISVSFEDLSALTKNPHEFRQKSQHNLLIHHNRPHFNKTLESAPWLWFY